MQSSLSKEEKEKQDLFYFSYRWKNNADQNEFDRLIRQILRCFTRVLTFADDHASAAQGLILRIYPSVVVELLTSNVFNAVNLR